MDNFIATHKGVIADLEIAYLESRYLPVQFFKEQVQRMMDFAENLETLTAMQ